jgi:hypothetical protein
MRGVVGPPKKGPKTTEIFLKIENFFEACDSVYVGRCISLILKIAAAAAA